MVNPRGIRVRARDTYAISRARMVDEQIRGRGIRDERLLKAMNLVPRHLFVEEGFSARAYGDHALPIGEKQTITQPFMVAFMIERLALRGTEKVLEIGSGSGYQSAVLSLLAERVFCIERLARIAARARRLLDDFHCANVVVRVGDGTLGWPDEAPFDAIISGAAGPSVPRPLLNQLKPGGRLIMPVGSEYEDQQIVLVRRTGRGFEKEMLGPCRFVKLLGKEGWKE